MAPQATLAPTNKVNRTSTIRNEGERQNSIILNDDTMNDPTQEDSLFGLLAAGRRRGRTNIRTPSLQSTLSLLTQDLSSDIPKLQDFPSKNEWLEAILNAGLEDMPFGMDDNWVDRCRHACHSFCFQANIERLGKNLSLWKLEYIYMQAF